MLGAAQTVAIEITNTIGIALVTAGVAVAESALLNFLGPPPLPSTSLNSGFGNTPAISPTYSLQAQGNRCY